MKLTQADIWLSKCIREANHWTCQKCGYVSTEGQMTGGDRRIQHSHFIGRQHKSTRYKSDNGLCLCASCHAEVETDPGLHNRLFTSIMGEGMAEILTELKHKPFKGWKGFEKEAAKHYRIEFERMRQLRETGAMGRLEFAGYV